jgi:heme/copper-type cytochrome/quinol oxidase subunit 3
MPSAFTDNLSVGRDLDLHETAHRKRDIRHTQKKEGRYETHYKLRKKKRKIFLCHLISERVGFSTQFLIFFSLCVVHPEKKRDERKP